jgi:hypothetical protein
MTDSELHDHLESTSITLFAEPGLPAEMHAGFLLAADLFGRFYPRVSLDGDKALASQALARIMAINPSLEATLGQGEGSDYALRFSPRASSARQVSVWASGWNVLIDGGPSPLVVDPKQPPSPLAACAAATIGVGEVFRGVFEQELGDRGRRALTPEGLNLVTLGRATDSVPLASPDLFIERFYLVGAGAIGQAAIYALKHSGLRGAICAVDPESVELSNLQRYVLTRDADIGVKKTALVVRELSGTGLSVVPVDAPWSGALVQFDEQRPVLVALDSAEDRIAVQASLPGPIYNAYTQPRDLGWSRHERFGEEACLACLYWPTHARPNRHEQIAEALKQSPHRVLAYLLSGTSAGQPLLPQAIPVIAGQEAPLEAEGWTERSILDDVAETAEVERAKLEPWSERPLADLYQDGICGGALLESRIGEVPRDVLVPLAHQSALAGVMLAAQFIASSDPALRPLRPSEVEGRFDVLSGPGQILPVPRGRSEACLCADADFVAAHQAKEQGDARVDE